MQTCASSEQMPSMQMPLQMPLQMPPQFSDFLALFVRALVPEPLRIRYKEEQVSDVLFCAWTQEPSAGVKVLWAEMLLQGVSHSHAHTQRACTRATHNAHAHKQLPATRSSPGSKAILNHR